MVADVAAPDALDHLWFVGWHELSSGTNWEHRSGRSHPWRRGRRSGTEQSGWIAIVPDGADHYAVDDPVAAVA
jgi:hypothetical protein